MLDRYMDAAGHALGEVVLVVANSGVNAVPVEIALGCRERGLRVVALTSLEQAKSTLCARVAELLLAHGRRPPVLASQNLDGQPAVEANAELLAPYLGRLGGRP